MINISNMYILVGIGAIECLPLTEEKPAAKAVNDQNTQTNKEPDYLDIPAFLRKQAD